MCAGSFGIHRAAVLVGVVVSPLFITDHLQRLTEVHQCGGEAGETSHSENRNREEEHLKKETGKMCGHMSQRFDRLRCS